MNEIGWMTLVTAGAAGGVISLRRSWRSRGENPFPWPISWKAIGWLAIAASFALASATLGPVRGLFIAFCLSSLIALVIVGSGYELRKARQRKNRSLAAEPVERPTTWWRSTLRWLLAGPIGMVAAMGIGIFYAAWTGGDEQTRLVIGGLCTPIVWGICMAWTLADSRILRATAVLFGVIAFGFGLSILKGFG